MSKFADEVVRKFADEPAPPRRKFSDSLEEEITAAKRPDFKKDTMAWLIQRYINEMNGWDGQPMIDDGLGEGQVYTLRLLQRAPYIGPKVAAKLTEYDVIDHAKWRSKQVTRRGTRVSPATINQDIAYLTGVLKYAPSAWAECKGVISDKPVAEAKVYLKKHGYIAKASRRTQVPTGTQEEQLLAFFSKASRRPNFIKAMPDIILFAKRSTRRLAEICRLERKDVDWEHKDKNGNRAPLYCVRDMKHPTKKKGNNKWFPLFPDLEEILVRQPVKPGDDRFFPFNSRCISQKYIYGKKQLGIKGLRFHDWRRCGITERLKTMTPNQVRHFFSGHNTTTMLETVYDATDPTDGFSVMAQQGPRRAVSESWAL